MALDTDADHNGSYHHYMARYLRLAIYWLRKSTKENYSAAGSILASSLR